MTRTALFALITILVGAASAPLYAHAQKAAITRVLFNAQTQNLEVMHRFLLHDAEHAVKKIFGNDADIIASENSRQQFADYVRSSFSIQNAEGTSLNFKSVGHELDGKFIWVYQEISIPDTKALTIKHNSLRELWPEQINMVNIEGKTGLKTATFTGSTELITITLDDVHH
ncbi:MAG: hypothetical protein JKY57_05505 [Kordiimonadaceae bacterium]|nr:hypothetical protein [Kordiimonadaceae bacterium]